ncbi:MAG: ABC transporter permease [Desulfobacteraceae bacterium]|nr:ABC transporter permease [Desulfobacteraceae bacterium]
MIPRDGRKERRRLRAGRQVTLPFLKSVEIAVKSIRARFFRSFITLLSLVLAISFYSYVSVNTILIKGMLLSRDFPSVERPVIGEEGALETADDPKQRWILFLSLLVCVVGIVNTQLMAVTERFREIGTMKCLGALDRFILRLFLIEAIIQGVIGAAAGAFLGTGVSLLLSVFRFGGQVLMVTAWSDVALSLAWAMGLGCLLSVIGVLYPALVAARMQPVEAMRGRE